MPPANKRELQASAPVVNVDFEYEIPWQLEDGSTIEEFPDLTDILDED